MHQPFCPSLYIRGTYIINNFHILCPNLPDAPRIRCASTKSFRLNQKNAYVTCDVRARPRVSTLLWVINENGTTISEEGVVTNNYWMRVEVRYTIKCIQYQLYTPLIAKVIVFVVQTRFSLAVIFANILDILCYTCRQQIGCHIVTSKYHNWFVQYHLLKNHSRCQCTRCIYSGPTGWYSTYKSVHEESYLRQVQDIYCSGREQIRH